MDNQEFEFYSASMMRQIGEITEVVGYTSETTVNATEFGTKMPAQMELKVWVDPRMAWWAYQEILDYEYFGFFIKIGRWELFDGERHTVLCPIIISAEIKDDDNEPIR